ncbi:MAG: ATP-binding cassette domain-containing protein [Desulfuromonadales bacterium]|nr:ATP-binding cassette domain-containing protein [Desulfuromonadales bacterium]
MNYAIKTEAISKQYGTLKALNSLDLTVERGSIFGLLGPNGAGKTTLIRILTTLMNPTSGKAFIEGLDVTTQGREVRKLIGVVSQENSLDRYLTARENLELPARLHSMEKRVYKQRIDELLELMELSDRQKDFPDTFSGGMQRRLVVARALVNNPKILFLDEPTTGLDPQTRRALWKYVRSLTGDMTIFLTTHYLEEAEQLCNQIAIIDHGRLIALGSSEELKTELAGEAVYDIELGRDVNVFAEKLEQMESVCQVKINDNLLSIKLKEWNAISETLDILKGAEIKKISLRERSLEDVYIALTGKEVRG